MWKRLMKRCENRTQALVRQLVDLKALREDAIVLKPFASEHEEFPREKICHAGHPGVARLTNNQIVFRRIDAEISPRVINDHSQSPVAQRMIVNVLEKSRRRNRRALKFDALNRSNWRLQHRTCRHATGKSNQ